MLWYIPGYGSKTYRNLMGNGYTDAEKVDSQERQKQPRRMTKMDRMAQGMS
jgi:hypothetical protein